MKNDCIRLLTDQYVLVALLLTVGLAVEVHLDGIDGRQVMEVEALAPEAQVGLELGRRAGVEGRVEAYLAEVAFLRGHAFSLQQPDLQRVVRATCLLGLRLHGFAQAVSGSEIFST